MGIRFARARTGLGAMIRRILFVIAGIALLVYAQYIYENVNGGLGYLVGIIGGTVIFIIYLIIEARTAPDESEL